MPRPDFTWHSDLGGLRDVKPSVQPTKFGDGYEARIATGINTMPKKWSLRFTRNYAEFSAILAFIETQAGVTSFTWTDGLNVSSVYVCRQWTTSQKEFGIFELIATFEQVFEA